MAEQLRIAIIGYGIAGITAAIHLQRAGHRVQHFERASAPPSSGAGLLLQPPTLILLRQLGLLDAAMQCGVQVDRIRGQTVSGRCLMDLAYADYRPGCFALGIQRRALIDLLRHADAGSDSVHFAHAMIAVDPQSGHLCDQAQKRHGPFDIIVVADGANSRIRQGLDTLLVHERVYPWTALVCLLDDPDRLAGGNLSQHFDGSDHLSFWPVGRTSPDASPRCSLSIKLPRGHTRMGSELGQWRQHILRLCPGLAPLLERASNDTPMFSYGYRDVTLRRYSLGRLVLLGDAAHSMSPQLGQGVGTALADAHALGEALRRHTAPAEALAAFDRHRRPQLRRYQRWSRWLTPAFQSDSMFLAQLRDRLCGPLSRNSLLRRQLLALLCDPPSALLDEPAATEGGRSASRHP